MDKLNHCMVDLETLSALPTAAILSIGAVQFNPYSGEIGNTFYTTILTETCKDAGLTISNDTLDWWMNQSQSAQKVLRDCMDFQTSPTLEESLSDFTDFFVSNDLKYVWSNGADFDLPILVNAYHAVRKTEPWDFWNSRCYRTIKSLFRCEEETNAMPHNALSDATYQAKHLSKIMGAGN